MRTTSPTLYSPFSSWAWYFFERRTVLPMAGCRKRRSTLTTTVLVFLSLTTTPWRMRFGIVWSSSSLSRGGAAVFVQNRFDAGDATAQDADAPGILGLAIGALEAEVELLLLHRGELIAQLVRALGPKVVGLGGGFGCRRLLRLAGFRRFRCFLGHDYTIRA